MLLQPIVKRWRMSRISPFDSFTMGGNPFPERNLFRDTTVAEPGTAFLYPPQAAYGVPGTYQPPGEEPVDYVCAKCGNIIQNPVVQNVITCENCGEKEYVGK